MSQPSASACYLPKLLLLVAAVIHRAFPIENAIQFLIDLLFPTLEPLCHTFHLPSKPFKSHSVYRTSGFLQVAVSKAPT